MVIQIISVGLLTAAGPKSKVYEAFDLTRPVAYPLRGFAYTCSIYLLILLTFERYVILCHLNRIEDMKAWVGFIYTLDYSCQVFKSGDTKLDRFLHKNPTDHTHKKLLKFENWLEWDAVKN